MALIAIGSCSGGSDPVSERNRAPVADAGANRSALLLATVFLDGSGSSDPDGDPLTCVWTFETRPGGSAATLSGDTAESCSFVPDVVGTYVVRLVVSDGELDSASDSVTITVVEEDGAIVADHLAADLSLVPEAWITAAKENLHIAYGHTSHGSQIITGMNGLDAFMGGTGEYAWNDGPLAGALDLDDYFMSGDLGNPDRTTWATRTRTYLDNAANADVNVVMWSWCGQASTTIDNIDIYLGLMEDLIADYPGVTFVFMTGHLDGGGLTGNLHLANEHIRNHCRAYDLVLFDFADIETYDPDGNWFGDRIPNDNCDYDSDDNGSRDANWAVEWQNAHVEGVDWYDCGGAHTQSLNSNRKAYAAWWLWARLAGWEP